MQLSVVDEFDTEAARISSAALPRHPTLQGEPHQRLRSLQVHFDFVTHPPVSYPKGTYLADWITDRSVDFITRHKDQPFFLYVAHFGVHSPFQAKKELIPHYQKKPPAGGESSPKKDSDGGKKESKSESGSSSSSDTSKSGSTSSAD